MNPVGISQLCLQFRISGPNKPPGLFVIEGKKEFGWQQGERFRVGKTTIDPAEHERTGSLQNKIIKAPGAWNMKRHTLRNGVKKRVVRRGRHERIADDAFHPMVAAMPLRLQSKNAFTVVQQWLDALEAFEIQIDIHAPVSIKYKITNGVCPLNIQLVIIIEGQEPVMIFTYEISIVHIGP